MQEAEKTETFLTVLQRHKGIIYKVARSYCSESSERQDLIQDIMVQIWKAFDSYSGDVKYSTWIYRIALNVAISNYRKQSSRKPLVEPLTDSVLSRVESSMEEHTNDNVDLLYQLIDQLNPLDKALLLLYLEGKNHREIAEIMGLSATNVSTRIGRLKVVLRQKFSSTKTN